MLHVTLLDGTQIEVSRQDAREVVPYAQVFASGWLRAPVEGLYCYRGAVVPVLGPLPPAGGAGAYLLVMRDHAQVIQGLPLFAEDLPASQSTSARNSAGGETTSILNELDELLKAAS